MKARIESQRKGKPGIITLIDNKGQESTITIDGDIEIEVPFSYHERKYKKLWQIARYFRLLKDMELCLKAFSNLQKSCEEEIKCHID